MNRNVTFFIKSFLSVWAILIIYNLPVRNAFAIPAVIMLGIFFKSLSEKKAGKRNIICSLILTFIITVFHAYDFSAAFDSRLFKILVILIAASGMYILILNLLIFFSNFAEIYSHFFDKKNSTPFKTSESSFSKEADGTTVKIRHGGSPHKIRHNIIIDIFEKHTVIFSMLTCLIFWLPMFLYEYPGIMSPDSLNQFSQVLKEAPLSNHHPIIHTFIISFFYKTGSIFSDSQITAVSFYTAAQMLFLAFTCSAVVNEVKKFHIGIRLPIIILAFYALVPYNAVFSVVIWKDVPFAIIVTFFTLILIRLHEELKNSSKLGYPLLLLFSALSILLSLFRSNGWYAFILMTPVLIYLFRKEFFKIFVSCLFVLIVCALIKGPVMDRAKIIQPDFIESCCIPLQQISLVLVEDKAVSDDDMSLIKNVVDTEHIKEVYLPDFADNMKELVRAGNQSYLITHKKEFLSLWLRLGAKYPLTYLKAWKDMTFYFLHPEFDAEIATIDGMTYPDDELFWSPLIGGKLIIKLKELSLKLGSFIPVYSLLFSAGFWAVLLIIKTTHSRSLVETLPSCAVLFTILISVPASDFRYIYCIILSSPLWLFYGMREKSGK